MIVADPVGPKSFYLTPGITDFTTAQIAAIDSTIGESLSTYLPYAHTATTPRHYNSQRFVSVDAGANFASNTRCSFGLFFTPENEKENLLWQLSGSVRCSLAGAPDGLGVDFFFGRKATNNTVVSDKASANNALANMILLPKLCHSAHGSAAGVVTSSLLHELVSVGESAGYVYCFGVSLTNRTGSSMNSMLFDISISGRKFTTSMPAFRPAK